MSGASPATLPLRAVLGCSGPRQLCAFFSFCRQVESSREGVEERAAGVLVKRGVKGRSFRDAGALLGGVLRRAVAVKGAVSCAVGGPAPSWGYRPLRALAGRGDGATANAAAQRGRAHRLAGWGL